SPLGGGGPRSGGGGSEWLMKEQIDETAIVRDSGPHSLRVDIAVGGQRYVGDEPVANGFARFGFDESPPPGFAGAPPTPTGREG
ncbi:MAG TPA: hypothetical protein VGN38_08925, partial [Caulobacteraceae bacterium]|nr:hypothetical protein [Caulobacteraceae bacterium]